jgi:hypothetical protein
MSKRLDTEEVKKILQKQKNVSLSILYNPQKPQETEAVMKILYRERILYRFFFGFIFLDFGLFPLLANMPKLGGVTCTVSFQMQGIFPKLFQKCDLVP